MPFVESKVVVAKALLAAPVGPGRPSWTEVPQPQIVDDTDAVLRVNAVTICGTDLHILKGDVPEVTQGRVRGP
jgi:alcohol dehydrogenase